MTQTLELTSKAAARIRHLSETEGKPGLFLRLMVDSGGCSGFQYKFSLETAQADGDLIIENEGAKLVVDKDSLSFVQGSQVDFVSDLSGMSFQIKNPNADSSCGCGTSFSVKM
jgi:iron-sulfur cluster insertion protein